MLNKNYIRYNRSRQNLAYDFSQALEGYIDEANESEVVSSLIDLLPDSTFDALQSFDVGRLFFVNNIFDESVQTFIDDLYRVHLNLPENEPVEITLNSGGGDVYAGELLIGAIQHVQSSGREVNITVQGLAASMASIILQVGTKRRITCNSSIMLHEVSTSSRGKLSSIAEDHEATRLLQDRLFSYYTTRTTKPVSYYHSKLTKKDVYLNSDDAFAEGLVDEIVEAPKYGVTPPTSRETKPKTKPKAKTIMKRVTRG